MREITILLTKYSDWISSLLYHFCGKGYTHASIGMEQNPETYYSFNYKGFAVETKEKHKRRGVRHSRCYRIQVSEEAYQRMQEQIKMFLKEKERFRYTRLGLLCCTLQIPMKWKDHYFCSQFVAELLEQSGAVALSKSSTLFLPNHFIGLMEQQKEYQLVKNII